MILVLLYALKDPIRLHLLHPNQVPVSFDAHYNIKNFYLILLMSHTSLLLENLIQLARKISRIHVLEMDVFESNLIHKVVIEVLA